MKTVPRLPLLPTGTPYDNESCVHISLLLKEPFGIRVLLEDMRRWQATRLLLTGELRLLITLSVSAAGVTETFTSLFPLYEDYQNYFESELTSRVYDLSNASQILPEAVCYDVRLLDFTVS